MFIPINIIYPFLLLLLLIILIIVVIVVEVIVIVLVSVSVLFRSKKGTSDFGTGSASPDLPSTFSVV